MFCLCTTENNGDMPYALRPTPKSLMPQMTQKPHLRLLEEQTQEGKIAQPAIVINGVKTDIWRGKN